MPKSKEFILPKCPIDSEAYRQLYEFKLWIDDWFEAHSAVQTIRIRPGMTEEAVYRLLPSAGNFEYGGYITKSRIRFYQCEAVRAVIQTSKPCTFHSHPTDYETADVPSVRDVHNFLYAKHLRTITVGAKLIWVWEKSRATLLVVKKLIAWAEANMLKEMLRLSLAYPKSFTDDYMMLALKNAGMAWPRKHSEWAANWEGMLRDKLKFNVRVFPRSLSVRDA